MRAVTVNNIKNNDFSIIEKDIPELYKDEYLIKVEAIGVGIQDGYFFPKDIIYPFVIGIEASGVIVDKGSDAKRFKVNNRVAFISYNQIKGGTWAEYAVVKDSSLILNIPKTMKYSIAAAIPVAGDAAIKALHALNLLKGEKLFIAGSSGANGTFIIQLAKQMGLEVAASASSKNHEYMKSLGADLTVDYHSDDWIETVKHWSSGGVDAAIAVMPNTSQDTIKVVKDKGQIVSVSGDIITSERNVIILRFPYQYNTSTNLKALYKDVSDGRMKVEIEKVYKFSQALSALENKNTKHARGKSVIVID